jgi:hypothetical protein
MSQPKPTQIPEAMLASAGLLVIPTIWVMYVSKLPLHQHGIVFHVIAVCCGIVLSPGLFMGALLALFLANIHDSQWYIVGMFPLNFAFYSCVVWRVLSRRARARISSLR